MTYVHSESSDLPATKTAPLRMCKQCSFQAFVFGSRVTLSAVTSLYPSKHCTDLLFKVVKANSLKLKEPANNLQLDQVLLCLLLYIVFGISGMNAFKMPNKLTHYVMGMLCLFFQWLSLGHLLFKMITTLSTGLPVFTFVVSIHMLL